MKKRVLYVASEGTPYAKSGGLGDVIGALPHALHNGWKADVIMPKYAHIDKEKLEFVESFEVKLGWRLLYAGIYRSEYKGVIYWFIDNEYYFRREQLYGYFDEAERYLFFSAAVVEWIQKNPKKYHMIHCHDWQSAWAAQLIKEKRIHLPVIFTIHNLRYQGRYGEDVAVDLMGYDGIINEMEFDGDLNLMKGALVASDYVTTVSPSYAEEVMGHAFGEGLDPVLRGIQSKFRGVLNGLDLEKFNPMTDPNVLFPYRYSCKIKAQNKVVLQEELGLSQKELPLIGFVSRLVEQKGLDLIVSVIHELVNLDLQFVVLGTGEQRYEELLIKASREYPKRFRAIIDFDEGLAQRIYAGSDMLLMPSRFEPCGLTQMIAQRYGSIPIVRSTGGLKDTVCDYDRRDEKPNGFVFERYDGFAMLEAVKRSIRAYQDPKIWQSLVRQSVKSVRSWEDSAKEYEDIYDQVRARYSSEGEV
jgi:starch synthase